MSLSSLDSPITWRVFFRASLLAAAEYAMLSLIEDSPVSVKIFSLICPLALLALLELDAKMRLRIRLFWSIFIIICALYTYQIYSAVKTNIDNSVILFELKKRYASAADVLIDPQVHARPSPDVDDDYLLKQIDAIRGWEEDTAAWIAVNVGKSAEQRFKDKSYIQFFQYLPQNYRGQPNAAILTNKYDEFYTFRRNLASIIENYKAYIN